MSIPGRGSRPCKGPEAGTGLVCEAVRVAEPGWESGVCRRMCVCMCMWMCVVCICVLLWCLGCEEQLRKGPPPGVWILPDFLSLILFCSSQLNHKGSAMSPCSGSSPLILSLALCLHLLLFFCTWYTILVPAITAVSVWNSQSKASHDSFLSFRHLLECDVFLTCFKSVSLYPPVTLFYWFSAFMKNLVLFYLSLNF